jgi:cytochrome c553
VKGSRYQLTGRSENPEVPSLGGCGFCHNPDFSSHDQIPRIAVQREDYLVKALREYKSQERRGYDPSMVDVARQLGDAEILDLAYYLANWR